MSIELLSIEKIQELAHQYGYWTVFVGIALENTGIPLPGETITIVGGFLAGSGELDYWLVLLSSIGGAILGDNFGYWIGKTGGWTFITRLAQLLRISTEKLEVAKQIFERNAAKAVFVGRFITLLRIFAGPMAGIVQMPYSKFLIYNCAGAVVWASTIVTLAFVGGRLISLPEIIRLINQVGLIGLGLLIILVVIPILIRRRQKRLS